MSRIVLVLAVSLCAIALVLLACGSDSDEVQLEKASQALTEAQAEVEAARARLEEKESAAKAAAAEFDAAQEDLRAAEGRLAGAQEKVGRQATEAAVFRAVQSALLEDDSLKSVAISARVEKGLVTLMGTVPDAKLRDRAVELARSTPGVVGVQSEIAVTSPGSGS